MTNQAAAILDRPGLIQVAGVLDRAEALMLARAGVHSVGIPLRLPVHTPDVSETEAREIFQALPLEVARVCITYEQDPEAILDLLNAMAAHAVQLHADPMPVEVLSELKSRDADLFVIKSLIVRPGNTEALLSQVRDLAPHVDAFITDTFDPATGATGATGLTHDWETSRALVERSPKPVILAGGLNPDNVARAIERVRPSGVDAHTGLEGPGGEKDPEKVAAFVRRARDAFKTSRA